MTGCGQESCGGHLSPSHSAETVRLTSSPPAQYSQYSQYMSHDTTQYSDPLFAVAAEPIDQALRLLQMSADQL